jgi:hypothetical protein
MMCFNIEVVSGLALSSEEPGTPLRDLLSVVERRGVWHSPQRSLALSSEESGTPLRDLLSAVERRGVWYSPQRCTVCCREESSLALHSEMYCLL